MRTLWIVGGGVETVPGIETAKRLGLHVVVSDGSAAAPGLATADEGVVVSTYDVDGTVAAARDRVVRGARIDGVICIATDVPVTVASVAAALELPGIPVSVARLAADKLAMKTRFVEQGIPVPWFAPLASAADLRAVVAERGLPLVIKPVDSRGARGVLRLTDGVQLDWAYKEAARWSGSGRVMVEEYLEGPQISTESLLLDGMAATPGFIDRNYEHLERFAPHMIENGGQQPSVLGPRERAEVRDLAESAGRALGICSGVVKGDLVVTEDGPRVIEVAARLSGGWMCTDQIPLATGVDFVGAAIMVALGDTPTADELTPGPGPGVAIRYIFADPGIVTAIHGVADAETMPGVHRLGLFVQPGSRIDAVTDHTRRAGFAIAVGRDAGDAVERAEAALARLSIETAPLDE